MFTTPFEKFLYEIYNKFISLIKNSINIIFTELFFILNFL